MILKLVIYVILKIIAMLVSNQMIELTVYLEFLTRTITDSIF